MPWLAAFVRRYPNIKPDLADAMLVYLAERASIYTAFTLDRRDFSVHRLSRNHLLSIIPAPAH
jgi:predicted nucleic acid-binding protein